jgi:hypothetical protein
MLLLAQLLCTRRARLRLIIARMVTRKQFPDAFLWPSREGVDLHIAVREDLPGSGRRLDRSVYG